MIHVSICGSQNSGLVQEVVYAWYVQHLIVVSCCIFLPDRTYKLFCMPTIQFKALQILSTAKTNGKSVFFSCLVAWPLNGSEAGGDLVLKETPLLLMILLSR